MQTTSNGEWLIDLAAMTCLNTNNNIVIGFEEKGRTFVGKVKEMPNELMTEWAGKPEEQEFIQEMVTEGEEIFQTAYWDREIEIRR